MPRRDGTGPMGDGPMSGWGMGPCGAEGRPMFGRRFRRPGYGMRRGYRRGFFGGGPGRGYGYGYGYGWTPEDEMSEREMLEEEREILTERLDLIAKQLEEE